MSVKILYKSIYVIGKCFILMGRKWFFIKYILGMGLSQIANGRKLVPYVTLLWTTFQTLLLLCDLATCCYLLLLWSLQFIIRLILSTQKMSNSQISIIFYHKLEIDNEMLCVTLVLMTPYANMVNFHYAFNNYWYACILTAVCLGFF